MSNQLTPIPEPTEGALKWSLDNPDAPREAVRRLNTITLKLVISVQPAGGSSLVIGPENAVLTISTKDIDLGTITGSKGSNAALTSLITALKSTFRMIDGTS
jgi:hypothetical protein